ncbi:phytanoyl-CoA dioxygenase family protein [Prochlorococcus sp. MIT 1307]|uniref:phytanoyl-CoA dioxygenase family protein n=1 Tax=Prochlorococcus sp. MIT 1307 TaxID=3096219 RepID=UPI002A74D244|nr:phytanoyl-CoA dioxygenase family protein [Prochlorococcus sp. MIT 1307]
MKGKIDKAKLDRFSQSSVLYIPSLFPKDLCNETCAFFLKNERSIIDRFREDKKGLTLDALNSEEYIKYFEYPIALNAELFGRYVNSDVFELSEQLLSEKVYIKSLEIHSRCAKGTPIPPHQDNAYYGLERAKGITFYIPINNQKPTSGGLQYYKVRNDISLSHIPSDESGFSLTIQDTSALENTEILAYNYQPGDCTIHHSNSVHFAEMVPDNTQRGLVVRLSLFSIDDQKKSGHSEWYQSMIRRNRDRNNHVFSSL